MTEVTRINKGVTLTSSIICFVFSDPGSIPNTLISIFAAITCANSAIKIPPIAQ